jgi:hypothetical protein
MSPIKAQVDNNKSKCADLKNGEHIEESTLKNANHKKNVGNKSVNRKLTW